MENLGFGLWLAAVAVVAVVMFSDKQLEIGCNVSTYGVFDYVD